MLDVLELSPDLRILFLQPTFYNSFLYVEIEQESSSMSSQCWQKWLKSSKIALQTSKIKIEFDSVIVDPAHKCNCTELWNRPCFSGGFLPSVSLTLSTLFVSLAGGGEFVCGPLCAAALGRCALHRPDRCWHCVCVWLAAAG